MTVLLDVYLDEPQGGEKGTRNEEQFRRQTSTQLTESESIERAEQFFKGIANENRQVCENNKFEIIDERYERIPEGRHFLICRTTHLLIFDTYVVLFTDMGPGGILKVVGTFDEDTWEEEESRIKRSVYSIRWSPYQAARYLKARAEKQR